MQPFPPEIFEVHALLNESERLLLYSLVRGLKPEWTLEIGTGFGGSAEIINAALEANEKEGHYGMFRSIDVDPKPEALAIFDRENFRGALWRGKSPDCIPDAMGFALPRPMNDLVFIDGDHSYEGVQEDIWGVIPYLKPSAYLLFHDVFYSPVNRAIDNILQADKRLTDCGQLTFDFTEDKQRNKWGGMRLLKWTA